MKRYISKIALTIAWALLFNGLLQAQTAQITGVVTDPAGAAMPGAEVVVTNVATGVSHRSQSNNVGLFTIPLINPGVYNLTASREGFKTVERSNIRLEVAQIARLDVQMELGNLSERVTVVAEAALLSSETAALQQVIGNKKIVDLPLNGRVFSQLATLTPGVVDRGSDSSMESPRLSINGGRNSKTVFLIDGGNVSSQYFDGAMIVPSVDAIEEFSVQSNLFSAEYGQGASVINVSLKSGANAIHGSVFEFIRNDALDAKNRFALSKPPLRQNQFGFTLGGAVTLPGIYKGKDRTFFFMDWEGGRTTRPQTMTTSVPNQAMRDGDFSATATTARPLRDPFGNAPFPGNRVPANAISPISKYFLPMYPLPNLENRLFVYSAARTSRTDRADVRIDHRFSTADSITGSYSVSSSTTVAPGQFEVNGGTTQDLWKHRLAITENHMFSPTAINELRLGYVRGHQNRIQQGLGSNHTVKSGIGGFEEQSLLFPGFPGLNISGFLSFNFNGWTPIQFRDNKYEIIDNFTKISGRHTIKMGVDFRRYDTNTTNAAYSRGLFSFNSQYTNYSFADFLMALPNNGRRGFPRNTFGIHYLNNQHFFLQDDWKVSNRLTLNLGMRYELNPPPSVLHNQIASTDPVARRIVVGSDNDGNINLDGQQIGRYLYPLFADIVVPSSKVGLNGTLKRLDKNNFAPRIGLAWRPLGNDLVIRGGYGIFYGLVQGNRLESTGIINPPFLADESLNNTPTNPRTLANLFASAAQGLSISPLVFFQLEADARDPYIQQWNLTIQKVVKGVLSLEGAYVGTKGTKIEFSRPINIPEPGAGSIQDRRPWSRLSSGWYVENGSGSTYNAFQGKAEIKSWRGGSMLVSYTYSKSLDNLSADVQDFSSVIPNNLSLNKGASDFDQRQRLVVSGNYELPWAQGTRGVVGAVAKGWEVGSIITLQTGTPFNPGMNNADSANTGISYRPDRVGIGTVDNRTIEADFDVKAFRVPARYTYGSASRNLLYARGRRNLDFVLQRYFSINERSKIQFRAEFFNLTNTPPFGAPFSNIEHALAGRITSAGEPRDIQLGLKLTF